MRGYDRVTRRGSKVAASVMAACIVAAAGAGSGDAKTARVSGQASAKLTTVNVGVIPIADVAPLYLGIKEGFFAREHLKLVPHDLQGGAAVASAVIGGSVQFGFGATVNLIEARAQSLPIQIIANGDQAASTAAKAWSGIVVGKGSPIKTIKQLAGKTIAANATDGVNQLALDAILQRHGVNPASVHVVVAGFPDMPAELESGKVNAVTIVEPFVSAIKAAGGRVISPLFEGYQPSMMVAGYFTTAKEIHANPTLVREFTTAINHSLAYAQSHPAAVHSIIPTYTSIPKPVAAKLKLPVWGPTINVKSIIAQERLMLKLHWIKKSVPASELIWSGAKKH